VAGTPFNHVSPDGIKFNPSVREGSENVIAPKMSPLCGFLWMGVMPLQQ
jgi:hypothetical protein